MTTTPLLLLLLLLGAGPALHAAGEHPYPDVYIHYHLDIGRGGMILSHETRWSDLVAYHLCLDLDKDGDGRTSAAEAAPFIEKWVDTVKRNFTVALNGRRIDLPTPAALDESLTWFATEGMEQLDRTEWEIALQFDLPLPPGEVPGEITLEDRTYQSDEEGEPDRYWVTNEIAIVGARGLRILEVTELPDPQYITRRIQARWDWQGEELAHYFAGMETTLDQLDRERLGQLLDRVNTDSWFLPLALLLALVYGMGHALAPGHGKAMVAGYLVGSKGTIKDAILLGLVVTLTHTLMVFLFALLIYFMRDRFDDRSLETWLGAASGVLVALLGLWLLWTRVPWRPQGLFARREGGSDHHHHHHHHPPLDQDRIPLTQLLWLGISGGIVPCPAALVVLLLSLRTAKPVYGLLLVGAFSLGLAGVLVAIGMVMVISRELLDRMGGQSSHLVPLLRLLPAISALCVTLVGIVIAVESWPRL